MIRVSGIRLPVDHAPGALERALCRKLGVGREKIRSWSVIRRSLDAREKGRLRYVYTIAAELPSEARILAKRGGSGIDIYEEILYRFPGQGPSAERPVVIGSGPAGLFCAYVLARSGYRPIVLERGDRVEERAKKVEDFWATGGLDPESNVQFGEGGAGTFSDGKLTTSVRDRSGRDREILRILVENGAPAMILTEAKPHLGTDQLSVIVANMRKKIEAWGGEMLFRTRADALCIRDGAVTAVQTADGRRFSASQVVLALGHSARDTFLWLQRAGLAMEPKAIAVGVRIWHPQSSINEAQYGPDAPAQLGPASYQLTFQAASGRGVYSFCMCPGGYVVNASSEPGRLAINGMSYSGRAGEQANSAIVATVKPDDYLSAGEADLPEELAGIAFLRRLEERAFWLANGAIPAQQFQDFAHARAGGLGLARPQAKGAVAAGRVDSLFPDHFRLDLCAGISDFGQKIPGFDAPEVLLAGVESRTSSPVRILRDEELQSNVRGVYPCGEGAGYAGGIVSAAIDGLRVAEKIALHAKL